MRREFKTTEFTFECEESEREYIFEVGFFHYTDDSRVYVEDIELTFLECLDSERENVINITPEQEREITSEIMTRYIERVEECCVKEIDTAAAYS
ncbi:hypothetical protein Pan241w_11510 [Gimesia alba]|uniref:Uncharacterized protein n=1 Tax=Gimesia alba TaxID=2527973 RepID=A0A517RB31_9PLAN|nr:hypothetical protein [Gimesia alba]QDT41092.1 hypothetical protein Pan241w_11510 [Gimesia alba]